MSWKRLSQIPARHSIRLNTLRRLFCDTGSPTWRRSSLVHPDDLMPVNQRPAASAVPIAPGCTDTTVHPPALAILWSRKLLVFNDLLTSSPPEVNISPLRSDQPRCDLDIRQGSRRRVNRSHQRAGSLPAPKNPKNSPRKGRKSLGNRLSARTPPWS